MKTDLTQEKKRIEPEHLIGTKWRSWKKTFGDQIQVEFLDRVKCIYTAKPRRFALTYAVREGMMFISDIDGPFELRGNVLYNNDIPTFEKVA